MGDHDYMMQAMKQKRRRDEEDLKGMDEEIEALFKKMSKAAEVQDHIIPPNCLENADTCLRRTSP